MTMFHSHLIVHTTVCISLYFNICSTHGCTLPINGEHVPELRFAHCIGHFQSMDIRYRQRRVGPCNLQFTELSSFRGGRS